MANSLIGRGKLYIATYSSGATLGQRDFRPIGNSSKFELSFSESKKNLLDYESTAGGVADSYTSIESVALSIDAREFTPDNLALALWGTKSALTATAVVDEAGYAIQLGGFVPTKRTLNTAVAPVIKKGATTIPAVDGSTTNWTASAAGITFGATLSGVSGVVDGDAITIGYTPLVGNKVETLLSVAPDVSVVFDGVNAVSNKPMTVRIYKAKLGAAGGLGFIGDDFGALPLSAEVQKDTTVSGVGLSQYFSLEMPT